MFNSSWHILGVGFYIYHWFGLLKNTALLLFIGDFPKLLWLDLELLRRFISAIELEPNCCFFKLYYSQTLEIDIEICSSLHI